MTSVLPVAMRTGAVRRRVENTGWRMKLSEAFTMTMSSFAFFSWEATGTKSGVP